DFTEGAASTPDSTSVAYSNALDTDQPLSFLMASSSVAGSELYQLNSVSISVTAVPEPARASLIAGFVTILFVLKRNLRRRVRQSL
ncbi:MAG TPA: hypothetical protein VJ952_09895, partial [Opitutales bacterium]|nr:hypothetical protein [Opitutales bacterium]